MKLENLVSASAAILVGFWAQGAFAQNLIANGEMNVSPSLPTNPMNCGTRVTGALPNGWYDNSCSGNDSGVNYLVDSAANNVGPTGLTVASSNAATPARFYAPFTMRKGYKYSAIINIKGNANQEVVVSLRLRDKPWTSYAVASGTVGSSAYRQFKLEGVAPLDLDNVPALLYVHPKTSGTIYVDSASVVETAATSADVVRVNNVLGKTAFGIHEHRNSGIPSTFLGSTGVAGVRRIWDIDGAQLRDIFPSQASLDDDTKRNWSTFEAVLIDATNRGIQLMMTLGGNTPAWAAADASLAGMPGCDIWNPDPKVNGPQSTSGPVNLIAFDGMVKAVIQHAAGRIKYWEVWNEPYNCSAFSIHGPGTDNMSYLTFYASDLKSWLNDYNSSHPGANLLALSPSFSPEETNLPFLDEYASRNGLKYADIVSVHAYDYYLDKYLQNPAYGRPDAPETYFIKDHKVNMLKRILNRSTSSANLPMWNTEAGYLHTSETPASASPQTRPMDDDAGAQYVARHLLLGSLAGLDASYYYAWDQDPETSADKTTYYNAVTLGRSGSSPLPNLCNGTNSCLQTAAGTAFAKMATWLTGATIKELNVDGVSNPVSLPATGGTAWIVKLQRVVNGVTQDQWIVWNPNTTANSTPVNYVVPAPFTRTTPLLGSKVAFPNGSVQLTGAPQLLTPN